MVEKNLFAFQNKSTETMPPFGIGRLKSVLSISTASSEPQYELVKPDADVSGIFVVNGPGTVPVDGFGSGVLLDDATVVLIDEAAVPAFGEICGPANGKWAATAAGTGLRCVGANENKIVPVIGLSGISRKRVAIIGGISAPSTVLGTPTSCVCAVLKLNMTTGQLEATNERITVKNFSKYLSAVDGTYGKAELDGVWELYWVDCGPSSDLMGLNPTPTPEVGEGGP